MKIVTNNYIIKEMYKIIINRCHFKVVNNRENKVFLYYYQFLRELVYFFNGFVSFSDNLLFRKY